MRLRGGGTNWGLSGGLGTGHSDAFQTGVYGITRSGPAYLAAALSFANHWMTTNRAAMGDELTASFDAQSYGARIEGGYRFASCPAVADDVGVTPYAALQAQDFHTPALQRERCDRRRLWPLLQRHERDRYPHRARRALRRSGMIAGMPLLLRARVAWAHDFVSDPSIGAVFQSLPGANFTVNGAPIAQNSALTSAGAELYITPRVTVIAKFDGEFAPGSQTYAGTGTLRYTW